ncbi:outer kinetochore KNL1 complex subunit ZWINT [Herpailurus yagouaroundi]|uniref:outer kinetochore KNL1 complex subunit ZWINT n=1 Tax=Herpailurus yagouaroundi TaxID=1608482 RepID=UPI001AD72152|nr:ZW10 interactor [Puma yagouaroundi]XP_040310122.1 ZW10 interactor [Puma yagouaroundi]XP_040310123.1 ZW10 interactor [Puma yagouaroundi]XP_040310124.1 ZW10 interactor [Puma yagouaroundi]XP_040310125.1 ZW10 interactor [Puma yagouaroundi]XP_040310126.1 ZW10 interactor [Puma yagouaroundi]
MEVAEDGVRGPALEALGKLAHILEPTGLQEEAELPAQLLAEFVMDSRKKDKLLCSQLQVVDFLQNFLAREDTAQGPEPLASEDASRQKAIAAKEQWKELKATYQEHVEAITRALSLALPRMEEAQRKRAQLQEALEELQAKKQAAMEKLRTAQEQWRLHQEKRLQQLAEASAEVRLRQTGAQQELRRLHQELGALRQQAGQERDRLQRHQTFLQLLHTLQGQLPFPEAETEPPRKLDPAEDEPQQRNTGDAVGRDGAGPSEADGPPPAVAAGSPCLPEGQRHGKGS